MTEQCHEPTLSTGVSADAKGVELNGRVALVTGAGRGVGAAIARGLALRGAAVAVNDISQERAEECAAALRDAGGTSIAAVADVTSLEQLTAVTTQVGRTLGPIDVVVNNAGVPATGLKYEPFVETSVVEWQPILKLNLLAVLYCAKLVVPSMIERGWGRIVSIISDAGRVGEAGVAVYSGAKAGAAGFSRALAKEVGPYGVTCNCLSLGSLRSSTLDEADLTKRSRSYPMRRLGEPADVAAAVLWLTSDDAAWVTGQTISINGGYSML